MNNTNPLTMRKIYLLLIVCIAGLPGFGQTETEEEINEFIDAWHQAAANSDQKEYFSRIAESGIYIGTDSTEIWNYNEFYEWSTPHFQNKKGWNFKALLRNIYLSDDENIAWFDEQIAYGKGSLRGSGILAKKENEWQIMHYVLSVPVPNEKFKEVMKVIQSKSIVSEEE